MACQLSLKQILPLDGSSVTFAVPLPLGSPFGTSCLPFIEMLNVLFPAAPADATANTAAPTSATASTSGTSLFMPRSSRARGRLHHGTNVVGPPGRLPRSEYVGHRQRVHA